MRVNVKHFALVMTVMTGAALCAPVSVAASSANDVAFATDAWDPQIIEVFGNVDPVFVEAGTDFAIAPPALNDSDEVLAELEVLRGYVAMRDEALVKAVGRHYGVADDGSDLSYEMSNPVVLKRDDAAVKADVEAFVQQTMMELMHFVMVEKMRFARVRPVQMDKALAPVIDAPKTPSYPAELAAASRFIAQVLGYVDPLAADEYKMEAQEIALRSEIAGLHFPSDSVAGVDIADEYFGLLLQNPDGKNALDGFRDALSEKG